ncbi:MAG TPA: acetyl-CoA C-acetyltransferase, partial [Alphaproteobacteria bacterium]|nr:acetyl-CoA C-acetyltransferase [Alphaproteobacteria bacterium]
VLSRAGAPVEAVDEVIMGQVLAAGVGQNPARQAALAAGLPVGVPAMTINQVCGSGLKAVHLAAQAVRCQDAGLVVAGGQENMSLAPHVLHGSRSGRRLGDWSLTDTLLSDGLRCAMSDCHMGDTAENVARAHDIDRTSQDAFAAQSQQRAAAALAEDAFREEIVPVEVPRRGGETLRFERDEHPRPATTVEELARLRPAFQAAGSVTAGNASGINDGAAAVLVTSAARARQLGLRPMARIVAFASAGVEPSLMGTGPVPATQMCLDRAGWRAGQLDLIEANEAFAAQALYVNQQLGWDPDKVNVHGGAIALGHPIGASGARILVSLLYGMKRRGAQRGLATLCVGGGQGVALAVERTD